MKTSDVNLGDICTNTSDTVLLCIRNDKDGSRCKHKTRCCGCKGQLVFTVLLSYKGGWKTGDEYYACHCSQDHNLKKIF